MNRPYIFCNMMTALDGKITGSYMETPQCCAACFHSNAREITAARRLSAKTESEKHRALWARCFSTRRNRNVK